jgi:bifunctional DNA-binding transcriptional regulator/antitoxin component of YhaV-PrlF toxin-antitoxin module
MGDERMTVVKVGANFSVQLPDWVQEELPAKPGDRIEFVPVPGSRAFILKNMGKAQRKDSTKEEG